MKTSSKIILTAVMLLLTATLIFDFLVKAEFVSGRYKNIYNNYAAMNFKDFDIVDIQSSTTGNVKFIQGPFRVMVDTFAVNYTKISQKGKRLEIKTIFANDYIYNPNDYLVIISCPKLSEVSASAVYLKNGDEKIIDTAVIDQWNMKNILIDGFKQDSLRITQSYASTIALKNNQLNNLTAAIGVQMNSGSRLDILNTNKIKRASFNVLNRSRLQLYNSSIDTFNYQLADSAKIAFTGAAQNLFNQAKPFHK